MKSCPHQIIHDDDFCQKQQATLSILNPHVWSQIDKSMPCCQSKCVKPIKVLIDCGSSEFLVVKS